MVEKNVLVIDTINVFLSASRSDLFSNNALYHFNVKPLKTIFNSESLNE
jgi:hypothetical protein